MTTPAAPSITFKRVERNCRHNEEAREHGLAGHNIIFDFTLFVNGEERGDFQKQSVSRGYQLRDLAGRFVNHGERVGAYDGAKVSSRAQFKDVVTKALDKGILPTVAECAEYARAEQAKRDAVELARQEAAYQGYVEHHAAQLRESLASLFEFVSDYKTADAPARQKAAERAKVVLDSTSRDGWILACNAT